jgi:hypothetical protein
VRVLRRLLTAGVLVAVLSVSSAHARVVDHNPIEATDPAGDSNGAPDITGVTVANDLSGMILFVVEAANRSGFAANDDVLIYIDSDRSAATGLSERGGGVDYLLRIDATTQQISLGRWSGTGFETAPSTTLRGEWRSGYVVFVNRSELGGTSAFGFFVRTRLQSGAGNQVDVAPTDAYVAYTLSPPHIEVIRPVFSPAAPRAGSTFRLNSVQLAFETGESARAAAFTCHATLARKRLRGTGRGACTFRVPKTAKGKRFVITITATAAGGKAETFRPYAFRVR